MKIYGLLLLRYSSRHEILEWNLRNYGKIVKIPLLKLSLIPKPFNSSVPRNLFTKLKLTFNYNCIRLLPFRNNSTKINHVSNTKLLNSNDNETKTALNQKLFHYTKKPTKTRDDLDSIRTILLTESITHQEIREALEILLKFKKYDWVQDVLKTIEVSSFDIRFIFAMRQALLGEFESLKSSIIIWPRAERLELLNQGMSFLINKVDRPQKAFLLWSSVATVDYPDLDLIPSDGTNFYRSSLRSILKVLKDPNDTLNVAFKHLSNDVAKSNICYYLSHSFYKISLKKQSLRVWETTPVQYRSNMHLSHILWLLSLENRNADAVEVFKNHPNLHDIRSKRLAINALIYLPFYKPEYYKTFLNLIKENHLVDNQLDMVLSRLVYHRRLNQFDEVIEHHIKQGVVSDIDLINYKISQASRNSDISVVIKHARKIQSTNQKPNERTYTLLLQQFSKHGNSKTVLSLMNQISLHFAKQLKINHYALAIEACVKALDTESLKKVQKMMKEANISPNMNIIENLMTLHLNLNQFDMVKNVFANSDISKPSLRMLATLLKSQLFKGDILLANITYTAIENSEFRKSEEYYLIQIEYYAIQGLFSEAYEILQKMKDNNVNPTTSHYLVLMSSLNKNGRYSEALEVFNTIVKNCLNADPMVYHQLLVALTKLDLINKRNFDRPIQVVDEIMNAAQNNSLTLKNSLPFIAIKPLIHTLIKLYKPDDAYRILTNFRVVNPRFSTDERLNYIKQELLLFSKSGKWGSFAISFDNFQQRIDSLLNFDGIAPINLRKVYNSIIRVIYTHANLSNELHKFNEYFHKLIFEQKFTFDSNNLNWITSRLVRNKETFHGALKIIEKKLIGGFIAKRLLKFKKIKMRLRNETYVHPIFQGHMLKPKLALGYINAEIVRNEIYKYILKESKSRGRDPVIDELKSKYPKLTRNLPEIFTRLNRRDRFLKQKREALGLVDGKIPKSTKPVKLEK